MSSVVLLVYTHSKMMASCLKSVILVIERQYARYFGMDITEELKKHIDSEEVMGMFAAAQQKAPNATPHHLSSKIRAQKNSVTYYLASLAVENKEKVIKLAISIARKH